MPLATEKAAIFSKGIWGSLFAMTPAALETVLSLLQGLPPTPHITSLIALIGSLLMILSKISPKQSQVTGLVAPKNAPESSDRL